MAQFLFKPAHLDLAERQFQNGKNTVPNEHGQHRNKTLITAIVSDGGRRLLGYAAKTPCQTSTANTEIDLFVDGQGCLK